MLRNIKRIVVKVGSQLLSGDEGIDREFLTSISKQISELVKSGKEVVVVSSGAVLAGIKALGFKRKPFSLQEKQALSAVGQPYLMSEYREAFKPFGINVAQVLITADDLRSRERFTNAQNTLNTLMKLNVIPIVNENDTVSVEEIKIGDNDNLSAHVAVVFRADILIMLTTASGLYDKDPNRFKDAKLIPVVENIKELESICDFKGKTCYGTGGMWTKVEAAFKAVRKGIPVVIAGGREERVILRILEGDRIGTFFFPQGKLRAKAYRMIYLMEPKGSLVIDKGAVEALVKGGKSLLPSGVKVVKGYFKKGDLVNILDENGNLIGKGISSCSFEDVKTFKKPCVHRDNLVLLVE
jgi:glutamate 5-kinase